MPFFEYRCHSCQTQFEELIRSDEDLLNLRCPQCGASEVEKLLSLFGMVTPSGKVVTSTKGGGLACSSCAKTSCAACN
jgi:putative FmdB family regulatory protein